MEEPRQKLIPLEQATEITEKAMREVERMYRRRLEHALAENARLRQEIKEAK